MIPAKNPLIIGFAALLATGAAFGLTSCKTDGASGDDPAATATSKPSSPASTESDNKSADSLDIDTEFTTKPSESKDPLNIDAQVRLNRVESEIAGNSDNTFTRFVVYFDGAPQAPVQWSTAGWQDEVTADGSGKPLDLEGKRKLQIVIAGVAFPEDMAAPKEVPVIMTADLLITDASIELPFEGYSRFQVAADEDFPYRVTVLDNPTRLVLDIDTPEKTN